jgi:hypothetical protein
LKALHAHDDVHDRTRPMIPLRCGIAVLAGALLAAATGSDPSRVPVSDFAGAGTAGWETQAFRGETRYRAGSVDGRPALLAESEGSASGLFRRVEADLTRTPYLRWSWRVERPLPPRDERSRAGDDYAARVYVVRSGGALVWRTRAVSYVWSGREPAGTVWPNAHTDRACMIAVRGPADAIGAWHGERRDVRADFRSCFGIEATRIDAVALMTDTDNAGGSASAAYGEIAFAAE